MKQTSRAVALLLVLESANAVASNAGASAFVANAVPANALTISAYTSVDIITSFNNNLLSDTNTANTLSNRTSQYK